MENNVIAKMNSLNKYKRALLLLVISILCFFSTHISADIEIPTPKVKTHLTSIPIPSNIVFTKDNNLSSNLSLAMNRVKQAFTSNNQTNKTFTIKYCLLDNLKSCLENNSKLWISNEINLQESDDEYALIPLLNKSNNKVIGITLAARTIMGWQYATDWLIQGLDKKNSQYNINFIHDYPTFKDRGIYSADKNPSLNYWKKIINNAAKLRIKEVGFSLVKNGKVTIKSQYLRRYKNNLFDHQSAFYKSPELLNDIIKYAILRGVNIVPTIPHPSSIKVNRFYPEWTMPNGRAIDWKKAGPQNFIQDLIRTGGSFKNVNKISVWADEGGIVDRQKYFIQTVNYGIRETEAAENKPIKLRLMISPVISQAIRTNKLGKLSNLLPRGTTIDFYAGTSYRGEPGTYHLKTPKIWDDILPSIKDSSRDMTFTGVGFGTRAQFNKVVFPYAHYIDAFLSEIQNKSGSGEYIYVPSFVGYNIIQQPETQYHSHRLWSGINNRLVFKDDRINSKWLLRSPQLSQAWENLMSTVFLSHNQRFRLRQNPKKPETEKNFKKFIAETKTGVNQNWISKIEKDIHKLENSLKNHKFHPEELKERNNIALSLLISKTLLQVRKLAQSITSTNKTQTSSPEVKLVSNKIINNCKTTQKTWPRQWKNINHAPHCAYLPLVRKIRAGHY